MMKKKVMATLKKLCSCTLALALAASLLYLPAEVLAADGPGGGSMGGGSMGGSGSSSSTSSAEELTDPIIDVVLNIGADESTASVTWYAKLESSAYLQIAEAADLEDDEDFPETYKQYKASSVLSNYSDYYSCSVTLTGLEEGTVYIYRVSGVETDEDTEETETVWSDVYEFTCTGSEDGSFSFLVVGDPQIGTGSVSSDTEGWIDTMTTALSTFSDSSFIVSVGDQIDSYTAGNQLELEYDGFLDAATMLQSIPLATTVGNHDAGNGDASSYSTHYTLPNVSEYGSSDDSVTGDEDYYFTYGNALFMVLNTNSSSIAEHQTFIEETIAQNEDCTWRVVVFHQSIYSVASHVNDGNISELRTNLSPVFTENDIDIVLMGHDHVYARSYIMGGDTGMEATVETDDDGEALTSIDNPDGVQYITFNSASGSKYYSITSELYTYTAVQNQEKTPNYSYATVTDSSFTVTTYRSEDNSVVDTITINKYDEEEESCEHENTEVLNAADAGCETDGYTGDVYCSDCGLLLESGEIIEATGHTSTTTVIKQATMTSNGSETVTCDVCGETISKTTIYKVSTIKLSSTTFTYSGSAKTPSVTVKDSQGNILVKGTDYTLSYASGRINTGIYSVKVTLKGNYSGTKRLYFKIKPKAVSIKSTTSLSSGFKVKWSKSSQASGYQIKYSTSSSFSSASTKYISSSSTVSLKKTSLKSKKTYYVKVRAYKKVSGSGTTSLIYSSWSKTVKIKTK